MSSISKNESQCLDQVIDANTEVQAYVYLEQLLLFPADIQDKIIEEISLLPHCNRDAIAGVIGNYSVIY